MDGHMNTISMKISASWHWTVAPRTVAGFCFLIAACGQLYAEDLPDPTRPPTGVFAPVAGTGREATENRSSGLRTIIISGTRRAAIIDGQTVELWGEHRGAKLVEVNEGNVVLQRARSRQVLTLFPDVELTHKKSKEPLVNQPSSESKAQSWQPKEKK